MSADFRVNLNAVPRRAVFDDLRVGQWVAWINDRNPRPKVGQIESWDTTRSLFAVSESGGTHFYVGRESTRAGFVTILRDVPAAPVTVQRADYDALVDTLDRLGKNVNAGGTDGVSVVQAARALIDNADTGADQ